MSLDLAVSQALMRARALERALHDAGPWTICVDSPKNRCKLAVTATRHITHDAVTFSIPYLLCDGGERQVTLACRGDEILVRVMRLDGYGIINLDWELRLSDPVAA